MKHSKKQQKNWALKKNKQWNELFEKYEATHADLAQQLKDAIERKLPEGFEKSLPTYEAGTSHATRSASGDAINAIAKQSLHSLEEVQTLQALTKRQLKEQAISLPANYSGRNIWFGVREFAMGTALNGMALHGGLHVFGGTFFVFSDYVRPAIRLSALMGIPVTYVFTHDSVAVGEDGPTHEPVEHLASLRAMPGLSVIRPADANETCSCMEYCSII